MSNVEGIRQDNQAAIGLGRQISHGALKLPIVVNPGRDRRNTERRSRGLSYPHESVGIGGRLRVEKKRDAKIKAVNCGARAGRKVAPGYKE